MITAYLTLYILAFGSQAEWPTRDMGHFATEDACWAKIDEFMGKMPREYASEIKMSWRCGGET